MNRNELRVIARIVLIGVGLYVVLQTFLTFFSSLSMMPFVAYAKADIPIMIIALVIYIVITLMVVYFLFRCANRFSAKIVETEPIDDTQISGIAVAFRLVCVLTGILFLYWSAPNLIVAMYNYISNMNKEPSETQIYIGMSSKTNIAKNVLLFGFGIYLAYGAPAFVRWQVRRTLKQCGKLEEQQPT
jgi:NADH:ubiquinone oxidoreductase subunit 5 (subunit L)/multisubunit Na+/H+ antiporter MnhA subunit